MSSSSHVIFMAVYNIFMAVYAYSGRHVSHLRLHLRCIPHPVIMTYGPRARCSGQEENSALLIVFDRAITTRIFRSLARCSAQTVGATAAPSNQADEHDEPRNPLACMRETCFDEA